MKPVRRQVSGARRQGQGFASRFTPHVSRLILVIGGASSGKSAVALSLADRKGPRAFVATGEPLDAEMAERIRMHQVARQGQWDTFEVPVDLVKWFQTDGQRYRTVVLDCLTLWLSNLLRQGMRVDQVPSFVADLRRAIRAVKARVVIVTNELGLGIVPGDPETREFRRLAGELNQQVACEADEVYLVLSGLPVRIK